MDISQLSPGIQVDVCRVVPLDRGTSQCPAGRGCCEYLGTHPGIVPLPEFLVKQINQYMDQYRPIEYLFEGWENGQYSTRSVQSVLKKALRVANISKNASVHSLRHTFATHSLEDGIDIRLIQEILGHRNIRTTEIYTHISNANILSIQSPIDKLGLE